MKSNREKSTSVMGFVVSVLLHGIFFAACLAIDYTHMSNTPTDDATEINQVSDGIVKEKSKS
ncbi:MAG TPA: hypothetical protein VMZ69_06360 [Saprospiraceae bacterium]|nr:hypothetical protein [Saprospiraceae bacterium]